MPLSDADLVVMNDIMSAPDRVETVASAEATSLAGYSRPKVVEHSSPTVQIGKKVLMTYTYINPNPVSADFGAIHDVDQSLV